MTPPSRQLGLKAAAAIVIGNADIATIGAGVFTSAGFQAAYQFKDPLTMMSTWIVGGVVALCGAAVYAGARLDDAEGRAASTSTCATHITRAGRVHERLGVADRPPVLDADRGGGAAVLVVPRGAVSGARRQRTVIKAIACVLIAGMTALHAFDTRIAGRVQTIFTIVKVALITGFRGSRAW